MDGRRNFTQDADMDSNWYPEERGYGGERGRQEERGYSPRYGDERDYPEQYRVPDPRQAGGGRYGEAPAYTEGSGGQFGGLGQRSGETVPASHTSAPPGAASHGPGAPPVGRPPGDAGLSGDVPADRTALHRPVTPPAADPSGAVYSSKRPGLAAALIALTVLFELPALRIFASSALASKVDAGGAVASMFLIIGLPMFALGLHALIGGAAAQGARVWLRTPLAYLPIGLLLFVAAALAG